MDEFIKQYADVITEVIGGIVGFALALHFLFGNNLSLKTILEQILERVC